MTKSKHHPVIKCDPKEDRTRQEFKHETDINVILARHGVLQQHNRPAQGAMVDYDMTLQDGIHAYRKAHAMWANVPAIVRKHFPSWGHVERGIADGVLEIKRGKIGIVAERKPAETAVPKSPQTPQDDKSKTPEPGKNAPVT